MIITITTRSTYMPMSRWGWMIAAHINYCWTHNTCSSIAKTHADALSNYWISRQTEQQGSCLCNCPQQCKHCTIIVGCVPNCTGRAFTLHAVKRCKSLHVVRLRSFGILVLWILLRSPPDLLHRWNSHVDRQSAMGKLVFACLWVTGNSCQGEQTTL